jgi:hypothetical protein
VSVQIVDDDNNTVDGAVTDCLNGSIAFEALPTQHLTFIVEGLEQGTRIWTNAVAATLAAGVNDPIVVSLEHAAAAVNVRWLFNTAAGVTNDCGIAGVATVNIAVFDQNAAAVTGGSFACDLGVGRFAGLSPGNLRFVADGISQAGNLLFSDQTGTPRGVVKSLELGDNEVVVTLEAGAP